MAALSRHLASVDPAVSVDLGGRQINFDNFPESHPPSGLTATKFLPDTTELPVQDPIMVPWEMVEASGTRSWTLKQPGAALVNAAIHVPRDGRLYVDCGGSRWQAVEIHGAPCVLLEVQNCYIYRVHSADNTYAMSWDTVVPSC